MDYLRDLESQLEAALNESDLQKTIALLMEISTKRISLKISYDYVQANTSVSCGHQNPYAELPEPEIQIPQQLSRRESQSIRSNQDENSKAERVVLDASGQAIDLPHGIGQQVQQLGPFNTGTTDSAVPSNSTDSTDPSRTLSDMSIGTLPEHQTYNGETSSSAKSYESIISLGAVENLSNKSQMSNETLTEALAKAEQSGTSNFSDSELKQSLDLPLKSLKK